MPTKAIQGLEDEWVVVGHGFKALLIKRKNINKLTMPIIRSWVS